MEVKIDEQIDQKMELRWVGILASIFNGFRWIVGSKLGGKMEPRSIQEGIAKSDGKMDGTKMTKKS